MNKTYDIEAIKYISRICEGGMRDGISLLEKCMSYSDEITVANVVKALGISDYEALHGLLHNILENHTKEAINNIENIYNQGKDLKLFIKQFIQFILDVCKYLLYDNFDYIQIPNTMNLEQFKGSNVEANYELLLYILDEIIELNNQIKYEQNPKILIESKILLLFRKEDSNESSKI